jgi:intracellular septation protein
MKFLFDLFPVLLFFAAYKVSDIFVATAVAVAASLAQVAYLLLRRRRVDPMLWVSLGIIVVFGGATLIFHDQRFILWKPTILYWFFTLALAGAHLFGRRNLLRSLMGHQLELPEAAWRILLWSWACFFLVLGVVNLVVAFNFPESTWVNFKVFGATALMLVFVIVQSLFLARHLPQKNS